MPKNKLGKNRCSMPAFYPDHLFGRIAECTLHSPHSLLSSPPTKSQNSIAMHESVIKAIAGLMTLTAISWIIWVATLSGPNVESGGHAEKCEVCSIDCRALHWCISHTTGDILWL